MYMYILFTSPHTYSTFLYLFVCLIVSCTSYFHATEIERDYFIVDVVAYDEKFVVQCELDEVYLF